MKDSGIAWIGQIPESWNLIRMKDCSYMKGRIGWQGLTADEFIDEGPFLVTGTDFEDGHVCWERSYHISEKRYNEAVPIQLQLGDLLVTKDGTIGKLAYIDALPGKASLNSHLLVIRPLFGKYCNEYLYWVLSSTCFQGYYEKTSSGSTMDSLSQEKIGEFRFFAPEISEQHAIAAYLDRKCGQIDEITADLQRQIECLQNYKKSLISEVVTKGLNPDVQMKDSGIEWIGQIPKHWAISRLRYIASICSGATPSKDNDEYWQGDVPWVSSQEVKTDILFDTSLHISEAAIKSCSTQLMPVGTLVMVVRSGILQHTIPVALLGVPATINQDVKAFSFTAKMLAGYFKYFVQGHNDMLLHLLVKDKSTVESIDYDRLLSCKVSVPPISEQKQIVKYLDEKCRTIDLLSSEKSTQIEIMKNHRKSVIYEYVTGKKRVKEVLSCP